jgi:2-methylisocitrate lyase-like PEP mutase family enzyme
MKGLKSKRARFRSMHSAFFAIPNARNVREIWQLEKLGFGVIASTSAGLSSSMGRDDLSLSGDETLQNIRFLCSATDLSVNADFKAGFSDDADGVATNITPAAEARVFGLSRIARPYRAREAKATPNETIEDCRPGCRHLAPKVSAPTHP